MSDWRTEGIHVVLWQVKILTKKQCHLRASEMSVLFRETNSNEDSTKDKKREKIRKRKNVVRKISAHC